MGIQSVHRALDILSLFSAAQPRLGITEMSNVLGLPKATVHGLVRTLVQRGFLYQDIETRKYRLGLTIYELGTILAGTLKSNPCVAHNRGSGRLFKTHSPIRVYGSHNNGQKAAFTRPGTDLPAGVCGGSGRVLSWAGLHRRPCFRSYRASNRIHKHLRRAGIAPR